MSCSFTFLAIMRKILTCALLASVSVHRRTKNAIECVNSIGINALIMPKLELQQTRKKEHHVCFLFSMRFFFRFYKNSLLDVFFVRISFLFLLKFSCSSYSFGLSIHLIFYIPDIFIHFNHKHMHFHVVHRLTKCRIIA